VNILRIHNYYLQPGGEDEVFRAESEVLRAHGHTVREFTVSNTAIESMGKVELAVATVWNRQMQRRLEVLLREDRPDVVHFHNTFPLVSPAAYAPPRRLGIPVIQTLHNFRLLCLNAVFLREGRICETCLGRRVLWPGVVHGCYRGSRPASAVAAAMLAFHRARGTWSSAVDTYVAVSEFARAKFIAGGLPPDRVAVKPNFLSDDPGPGSHGKRHALFVGRLSPEKGLDSLLRAWRRVAQVPGSALRVIGTGPLEGLRTRAVPGVEWLGWQNRPQVLAAMREAAFLVFPSECYEGLPMVVLEAMATGLPVIGSSQGSLPEVVDDGGTGLLVPAGDIERWAAAMSWALEHPRELERMSARARQKFERSYSAEAGYAGLIALYGETLERSRALADRQ